MVSYYEDRIRPVSEAVLYREYSNLHRADTAPVPDAPEREGYRFTGWYIASGSGFISAEEERLGQVTYATSYFASWEPIEPFSTTAKKGDVDGDGRVVANDLVLLLSYFSTGEGLTEQGAQNADMDNDGVLRLNDLVKLLNVFTLGD